MEITIEEEQQMLKIWQSITSKPMTDREVKFAMAVAEAEREACAEIDRLTAALKKSNAQAWQFEREVERLQDAIQKTLDENRHLADGENCTLIVLKHALSNNAESNGGASHPTRTPSYRAGTNEGEK